MRFYVLFYNHLCLISCSSFWIFYHLNPYKRNKMKPPNFILYLWNCSIKIIFYCYFYRICNTAILSIRIVCSGFILLMAEHLFSIRSKIIVLVKINCMNRQNKKICNFWNAIKLQKIVPWRINSPKNNRTYLVRLFSWKSFIFWLI